MRGKRLLLYTGVILLAAYVICGTPPATERPPEAAPTNTPVFVATAAPLPTFTPGPPPTRAPTATPVPPLEPPRPALCDASYPDVCVAPYPPDLDCGEIPFRRFRALPPDPHGFDGDGDGIGCERD